MSLRQNVAWRPILTMALVGICLVLGDAVLKRSYDHGASILDAGLVLSLTGAVAVAGLAALQGGLRSHLSPSHPGKLAVRAALLLITAICNISSLYHNPLSSHAALFQLSPVLAALIAARFAGHFRLTHWIALGAATLGAAIVVGGNLVLMLAIGAALGNAASNLWMARNGRYATPLGYAFYASLGIAVVMGAAWAVADRNLPTLPVIALLCGSSLLSLMGVILAAQAMRVAGALAPVVRMAVLIQLPIAFALGAMMFAERLTPALLLGVALIIFDLVWMSKQTKEASE